MATEMTPARSDARAPQIMRDRMSRPISSVPSQCAEDGGRRIAVQLVAFGSAMGSTGASSARRMIGRMMTAPTTKLGLRRRLRQARLPRAGIRVASVIAATSGAD